MKYILQLFKDYYGIFIFVFTIAIAYQFVASGIISWHHKKHYNNGINNFKFNHISKTDLYIKHYAKKYKVKVALVKGIIKVESNNGKYIKSSSGACGIMQIEPETAYYVTHKHISCKKLIKNKKLNIKIGIKYLGFLLKIFPKVAYAIAAYNAGPTIAYKWYKQLGYIPQSINPLNNVYGYTVKVLNYTNKFLNINQSNIENFGTIFNPKKNNKIKLTSDSYLVMR